MVSVSEAPNPERGLHERKSRSTKTRPAPPVPSLPGTSATLNSSIRKVSQLANNAYLWELMMLHISLIRHKEPYMYTCADYILGVSYTEY